MRAKLLLAFALTAAAGAADARTQPWKAGWDNFAEPLNFTSSAVVWAVATTGDLKITYVLVAAKPTKLYQVGVHLFCTTAPKMFGRFPVAANGTCGAITRQGVTAKVAAIELGVVLTDASGNGSVTVDLGPVAAGTYKLEFTARDGAGCNVTGGGGVCGVDFQSPGPFGTTTIIRVP
jgi:hypothetical protein